MRSKSAWPHQHCSLESQGRLIELPTLEGMKKQVAALQFLQLKRFWRMGGAFTVSGLFELLLAMQLSSDCCSMNRDPLCVLLSSSSSSEEEEG